MDYVNTVRTPKDTKDTGVYYPPRPPFPGQVVLQHLRPFAPMEVMNTRVCSKASPAPGNTGFDGCVELLSLECRARERALTVWDDVSFLHIDKAGVCSSLRKQAMLHLSLPTLRFLWKNMRSFTVCGEGREPPREVARAVIRTVGWGAKQVRVIVAHCFLPPRGVVSLQKQQDSSRVQTFFQLRILSRISSQVICFQTMSEPFVHERNLSHIIPSEFTHGVSAILKEARLRYLGCCYALLIERVAFVSTKIVVPVANTLFNKINLHLVPGLPFLLHEQHSVAMNRLPPTHPTTLPPSALFAEPQSKIGPLSAELSRRVMSFVLSGDPVTWRSVAAGLGVGEVRRAAPNANGEIPNPTVAFSNKKKRHNFNL